MLTQRIAIKRTTQFVKELDASGLKIKKAYLFGSYVKNKQQPESDVDVALVSDIFTGDGFADGAYTARINNKKEYQDIEIKTYPTAYFKKGDPFIDEIKKHGIELAF